VARRREDVEPGIDEEQRCCRGRSAFEPRRPPPGGDGDGEEEQREGDVETAPGDVPMCRPVFAREHSDEEHDPGDEHERGEREEPPDPVEPSGATVAQHQAHP
jgi:hypothetical protein